MRCVAPQESGLSLSCVLEIKDSNAFQNAFASLLVEKYLGEREARGSPGAVLPPPSFPSRPCHPCPVLSTGQPFSIESLCREKKDLQEASAALALAGWPCRPARASRTPSSSSRPGRRSAPTRPRRWAPHPAPPRPACPAPPAPAPEAGDEDHEEHAGKEPWGGGGTDVGAPGGASGDRSSSSG